MEFLSLKILRLRNQTHSGLQFSSLAASWMKGRLPSVLASPPR